MGGPSSRVQPVTEVLPRGSRLWRVHHRWHRRRAGRARLTDDGTLFNPGLGEPTRFGPFRSSTGDVVPLLYVGATRRGALFETVLHDQMPGSVVDSRRWADHILTELTLTVDLHLVALHGEGLRSLCLFADDITHTYPSGYPLATRWAAWLHAHTDASGLAWASHQDDDERAFVLFGDRLPSGALVAAARIAGGQAPLSLGAGDGLDWAKQVAAFVRIEVIP